MTKLRYLKQNNNIIVKLLIKKSKMKKTFLTLLAVCAMFSAMAQTKVELKDFQPKASTYAGQSVQVSGYLVEIGKDGKSAIISENAEIQKPSKGQENSSAKPSGKPAGMVHISSETAINTSLKGKSVTVTGVVSEEKMPEKPDNGNNKDTLSRPNPPKNKVASDTLGKKMPPEKGQRGGGKHYVISNAVITEN